MILRIWVVFYSTAIVIHYMWDSLTYMQVMI